MIIFACISLYLIVFYCCFFLISIRYNALFEALCVNKAFERVYTLLDAIKKDRTKYNEETWNIILDHAYLFYLLSFSSFLFLFCFVLFCFVLFCFVLFCFVLFCFVLSSTFYSPLALCTFARFFLTHVD